MLEVPRGCWKLFELLQLAVVCCRFLQVAMSCFNSSRFLQTLIELEFRIYHFSFR